MVLSILACESAGKSKCFGSTVAQNIGTSHGFEHPGLRKCGEVPMFRTQNIGLLVIGLCGRARSCGFGCMCESTISRLWDCVGEHDLAGWTVTESTNVK